MQSSLPILTRSNIEIKGNDVAEILNKEPGKYIKDIIEDIEKKILENKLNNNYEDLKKYIIKEYKDKI